LVRRNGVKFRQLRVGGWLRLLALSNWRGDSARVGGVEDQLALLDC
jgi:hypothetical protein